MRRFFARVFAPDRRALLALQSYGLDLFRGTAVVAAATMRMREEARAAEAARAEEGARAGGTAPGPATTEKGPQADSMDALLDMPWIDGLLTIEEIERLVVDGYRVLVNEDADKRARARTETIEFQEWLKGMEEG
jgi:hypothetical protein